jgi:hypothetical protein
MLLRYNSSGRKITVIVLCYIIGRMVRNLQVPQNMENVLTSLAAISFLNRIMLCGVR